MTLRIDCGTDLVALDDVVRSAYQYAVTRGRFERDQIANCLRLTSDEVARAERALRQLCLLHPVTEGGDLVPVSPDAAAVALVGATERQIHHLQQGATEARARLASLTPLYVEGKLARCHSAELEMLLDPETAQSVIDELIDTCKTEVLMVRPGNSVPPQRMSTARPVALELVGRNVQVRGLVQHTALSDPLAASCLRDQADAGVEIRTCSEVIDEFTVFDRTVAVLPRQESGVVVVREPTVLAFLCRVFDQHWDSAWPYRREDAEQDRIADVVKRAIVRLMAEGHKDEVVARRLGISVRTCRRHIAELMEALQATTRFQAGVYATRSGLLTQPTTS